MGICVAENFREMTGLAIEAPRFRLSGFGWRISYLRFSSHRRTSFPISLRSCAAGS